MSKISEKISNIFGFTIKEREWNRYLGDMDREGEPTRKNMAELIFAVCEEIEIMEKELKEMKETNSIILESLKNAKGTTQKRNAKVDI